MAESRTKQPGQDLPNQGRVESLCLPRTSAAGASEHGTAAGLHLCPSCESTLVLPVDWSPAGEDDWNVSLRCPECDWRDDVVASQATVDELDRVLDDATDAITNDLAWLSRANLEEEVERFTAALHGDHIAPEDF